MATNEDNDEAEQLRYLALKSMVKRSKPNCSNNDADDQDIKFLRAAALKTITHKSNAQSNLLVNKDDKLVNEKKRSLSGQLSTSRYKKITKLNESQTIASKNLITSTDLKKSIEMIKHAQEQEYKRIAKLENKAESQSKPSVIDCKDTTKKIVRNGSMQLSNLDSEKFDETMVLRITFSSSESDDSSSEHECDTNKKEVVTQKTPHNNINNSLREQCVPAKKAIDVVPTNSIPLEDNKIKMNNCLKTLCGLMRNCEAEIEKRNQQVEILLEAYEKYQNCNKSLSSILQTMKTTRDELSIYHSLENLP